MRSRLGTVGAALLQFSRHASTFLPTFPRRGFASRASHGSRRIGTTRALPPARLAHAGQVSPLPLQCRPNIPPPTTSRIPEERPSGFTSTLRVGPSRTQASPSKSRLADTPPPKRVRHPTGCSFASGCSPPRLTATQLLSATQVVTSYGLDLHQPDTATSRTHSWPRRQPSTTNLRLLLVDWDYDFKIKR